ncbi:MAG: nucleotidyltransferase [Thiotrichales bacterium]|jgi:predicted nucleotidyltransferase|nr:nucleotidyltransferase [Thiotrichales bacterium]MBT5291456.1 nucleotidyltransferase [Thiotrichales bacterium]MBT6173283.1 nucleotidyltransferase [Thiotrichales bacterium]MBT6617384.1 nucleotidyltransferase [Thiotrichales bacterium]MBT7315091.1 nucleotidyltransferase [Thiotrichales bacterium]
MKPSNALKENRELIRQIVSAHRASSPRVFGSVLHDRDREGSDLDLLVEPTSETTLFDIGAIRSELTQALKVSVDVLTPNALPDSFRESVLAEALPV